jgi:adenine nucleotide transporter 17
MGKCNVSKNRSTLYRGLLPVLESLCVSNFVYFYSFHGLKSYVSDKIPASALRDLFLGSVAGTINVLTTTPLWVVNTRMKMQGLPTSDGQPRAKYNNLLGNLDLIYDDFTIMLYEHKQLIDPRFRF